MFDDETCYRIISANDRRFDGLFFVGVSSTGVYCRPSCPAKLPKRENCTFFPSAAAAEAAGYRPCLKCRPELAPGVPASAEMDGIAQDAARHLCDGYEGPMSQLAAAMGVSERHFRRIFEDTYGASPIRYRTTCRLLLAKSLLTETQLSIPQVAQACGYSSTRRFEEAFTQSYRMAPSHFRKKSAAPDRSAAGGDSFSLTVGYRPPYPYELLIAFLRARGIAGVESVGEDGMYRRITRIGDAIGWVAVQNLPDMCALRLTVSNSLIGVLLQVIAKARLLFDVDCDPIAVEQALADFYEHVPARCRIPGVRLPCSFDGFEMTVRAILGQQITVSAATTLAGRVAAAFGEPYPSDGKHGKPPFPELTYVFPRPEAFCTPDAAVKLSELGVVRTRAEAICAIAREIVDGTLCLSPGADPEQTMMQLQDIRGIGPWTAHYAAMRALAWPDAFPKEDYGIKQAFPGMKPREIEALSQAWHPYRSYAVMSLWQAPHE